MTDIGKPLLCLEGVGKTFYTEKVQTNALSDIHLKIYKGEFVTIAGPSGCGKSTLLSILGLLDSPTAGRYFINQTAMDDPLGALRRRRSRPVPAGRRTGRGWPSSCRSRMGRSMWCWPSWWCTSWPTRSLA